MKSFLLSLLLVIGAFSLYGCVPADKEYGMCTDLGLCPDCDDDDDDCKAKKEEESVMGHHDHNTMDHTMHDNTQDNF